MAAAGCVEESGVDDNDDEDMESAHSGSAEEQHLAEEQGEQQQRRRQQQKQQQGELQKQPGAVSGIEAEQSYAQHRLRGTLQEGATEAVSPNGRAFAISKRVGGFSPLTGQRLEVVNEQQQQQQHEQEQQELEQFQQQEQEQQHRQQQEQQQQQQERQQQQQQGVKGGSTEAGAAAHVSMAAPARKLMPSMVKPNATVSSDL
jgi:hypothetical protein